MTHHPATLSAVQSPSTERRVRAFVEEIEPLLPARAARLLANVLVHETAAAPERILDLGGGTGDLARELLAHWDHAALELLEFLPAIGELARARFAKLGLADRTTVHTASPTGFAPAGGNATLDLVVANLVPEELASPPELLSEAARLLRPGGRVAATFLGRGSWTEFTDVFRETLRDLGRPEAVAALDREEQGRPAPETLTAWAAKANLTNVRVDKQRFTLLFRSAREFFYAPLVEGGPLPGWKGVAGQGEHLQDAFFFTKEALETYFATAAPKGVLPMTVVICCLRADKPQ